MLLPLPLCVYKRAKKRNLTPPWTSSCCLRSLSHSWLVELKLFWQHQRYYYRTLDLFPPFFYLFFGRQMLWFRELRQSHFWSSWTFLASSVHFSSASASFQQNFITTDRNRTENGRARGGLDEREVSLSVSVPWRCLCSLALLPREPRGFSVLRSSVTRRRRSKEISAKSKTSHSLMLMERLFKSCSREKRGK